MSQTIFTIEQLEERIAPSAVMYGAQDPVPTSTAETVPIGTMPNGWHPLWPVDPWPPGGGWPVS